MKKIVLLIFSIFIGFQAVSQETASKDSVFATTDIVILRGERYSLKWPDQTRPYTKMWFEYTLPDGTITNKAPKEREGVKVKMTLKTDAVYKDGVVYADSTKYVGYGEYILQKSKKPVAVKFYIYKDKTAEDK